MQSCDPQLLDLCGDLETTDSAEASPIVVFLTVSPLFCSCPLFTFPSYLSDSGASLTLALSLTLKDSQRVQKILWRQLFVLDSMVSLVEELKSAQQLLTQPCPAPPGN